MPTTLTLGRDPSADIVIGDPSVSRRHAELVLLDDQHIFVRDLGTSNGTTRVRGGTRTRIEHDTIQQDDEVAFGDVVIAFGALREMLLARLGSVAGAGVAASAGSSPAAASSAAAASPARAAAGGPAGLGEFNPLAGELGRLRERGLLWPGIAFVLLVIRLGWLLSSAESNPEAMASFVVEFSLVLVFVGFCVVYWLCGKRRPWTMIAAVMLAEAAVMACHPVLQMPFCVATGARPIIQATMRGERPKDEGQPGKGGDENGAKPGAAKSGAAKDAPAKDAPADAAAVAAAVAAALTPTERPGFLARLWAFSTCAGLLEELEKMLPVFGLIWISAASKRSDVRQWGVSEPLDAIVYASAAACTFIVIETFSAHGYVGRIIDHARTVALVGNALGVKEAAMAVRGAALETFPLAVFRTIDALTGHVAYSGYFAYFVGLGLLRTVQRERLWLGGWLVAALIHGFFDAVVGEEGALLGPAIATAVAFFFLIGVILNARKISPTRDENFATRSLAHVRRA